MRHLFKGKLHILLCLVFNILLMSSVKAKEPILMYNQFPMVWNMDFDDMKSYLSIIAKMGFNVVWVNPFFQSGNGFVVVDRGKGIPLKVRIRIHGFRDVE